MASPNRLRSALHRAWLSAKALHMFHGKQAFIGSISLRGETLDVGCGNDSPYHTMLQRPDIRYTGLDVADYGQTTDAREYAGRYILTTPEKFADEIADLDGQFDAIICAHNLEHCLHPEAVLRAMCRHVKKGGRLYLSFPCEASLRFPRRLGTLNFHDDPTHSAPPSYAAVLDTLRSAGLSIAFARRRYRPPVPFILGLLLEPLSFASTRVMPLRSTWALYGFETVIWAVRPS
jgi:SAM-dependent methyltransferase